MIIQDTTAFKKTDKTDKTDNININLDFNTQPKASKKKLFLPLSIGVFFASFFAYNFIDYETHKPITMEAEKSPILEKIEIGGSTFVLDKKTEKVNIEEIKRIVYSKPEPTKEEQKVEKTVVKKEEKTNKIVSTKNEVVVEKKNKSIKELFGATNSFNYYIQIAVIPDLKKMDKTFKKIETMGYSYKIEKITGKNGQILNRVLVGSFEDYKTAKSKLDYVNNELKVKGFIKKI